MNKPSNPLRMQDQEEDGLTPSQREKRDQEETIYRYIMRGGGEPFGAPYEMGKQSLTEKIVRFFKQKSFFGFETMEPTKKKKNINKFTRYGASRYRGPLKNNKKP
tara:strand:- start:174 stop:488 length:315 start_codon:yes stop_codon:yes gene_type:complete